jgi:hypothetical protein
MVQKFKLFACILVSVALWTLIVSAQERPELSAFTQKGEMSSVLLIEVGLLDDDAIDEYFEGAESGLLFIFYVVRNSNTTGNFTLSELRDFTINGESYTEKTHRDMGRTFEPGTIIEDYGDFITYYRPDLKDVLPVPSDPSCASVMILRTGVAGSQIPEKGMAEVEIQVGWGKALESFTFQYDIAGIEVAKTPFYLHAPVQQ